MFYVKGASLPVKSDRFIGPVPYHVPIPELDSGLRCSLRLLEMLIVALGISA